MIGERELLENIETRIFPEQWIDRKCLNKTQCNTTDAIESEILLITHFRLILISLISLNKPKIRVMEEFFLM